MNICDLENEELQAETKDLLKEASVRQRAPTGLFKDPRDKQSHNGDMEVFLMSM